MNPVDLALVALFLLAALRGAARGFFRESFGLFGFISAFAVAFYGTAGAVELLRSYSALSAPPPVQSGVVFVLLFAGVQSLFSFFGYVVERLVTVRGLSLVSRVGGGVVGGVRATVGSAFVVLCLYLFQSGSQVGGFVSTSRLARPLIDAAANAIHSAVVQPERS